MRMMIAVFSTKAYDRDALDPGEPQSLFSRHAWGILRSRLRQAPD
jgi:hypothetical protein